MTGVRDTTALAELGAVFARDGIALTEISEMHVRDAGGLSLVYSQGGDFGVTVPASAYGAQSSSVTTDVTTEIVTAAPFGGTAPYTYAWTRVDVGGTWAILSPASISTAFRADAVAPGTADTAQFKCTVTDARGLAVDSIEINATAENYGGFEL